jgi:hypothetical protein
MNKNMKKIKYQLLILLLAAFAISSCEDVVETTDLKNVTDDLVWNEPSFIKGAVDFAMSGKDANGVPDSNPDGLKNVTDEGYWGSVEGSTNTTGGIIIAPWSYKNLRNINRFLDAEAAGKFTSKLAQATKEDYIGQMLVLRAWLYFDMVRTYGGVPLILHEQAPTDELTVPRSKTSVCIQAIVDDLDAAIALPGFPMKRTENVEAGRINKAAAYALKGRVLLFYASPQFSKTIGAGTKTADQRWEEAYQACKKAVTELSAAGYALYKPNPANAAEARVNYYNMFIKDETPGNPEMVWVRRHEPNISNGNEDRGQTVSVEFANSFGKADGTPYTDFAINYSKDAGKTLGDITYGEAGNGVSEGTADVAFWENREPRFYATIAYNGAYYPLIRQGQTQLADIPGQIITENGKTKSAYQWFVNQPGAGSPPFGTDDSNTNGRYQGLTRRKFVNEDLDRVYASPIEQSGTDWPIIRYAEVLLNYAECAAMTGKSEAGTPVAILGQIRQRAGIPAANNYGLGTLTSKADLIYALLHERGIELALENHRFFDLRRWRLYLGDTGLGTPSNPAVALYWDGSGSTPTPKYQLNGLRRHAMSYRFVGNAAESPAINTNLDKMKARIATLSYNADKSIPGSSYFTVFYQALAMGESGVIAYPNNYDFFHIAYNPHISSNPTLEQTIGWEDIRGAAFSTFNPYE